LHVKIEQNDLRRNFHRLHGAAHEIVETTLNWWCHLLFYEHQSGKIRLVGIESQEPIVIIPKAVDNDKALTTEVPPFRLSTRQ
jgi:hypothetical protein